MNTYLMSFLFSLLLTLAATPIVIKLAYRINAVDYPGIRKVHSRPIPRVGGIAIFVPAMVTALSVLFLDNVIGDKFREIYIKITAMLIASSFIFVVGLIDDIRGIRAKTKLLCQLSAAIFVCAFGVRISYIILPGLFALDLGLLSWPLTIFWIVGLTNAVNLVDGLDGLAAGLCTISCGVIVILSIYFYQPVMAVIMLSLLGALAGFLFFNFNPAKIFMGDCGSLFLGFTIASAGALCAAKTHAIVGLALPILALGIPIFDTLLTMLRRFLNRRSIFSADREHFHHRLLALGLKHRHVVVLAYIATLIMTALGMFMLITRDISTIMLFACIVILLVFVFRVIGSVKLSEVARALQKKHILASEIRQEKNNFEEVQLYLNQAKTFDQWWQSVCLAAENMKFETISMPVVNRDGTRRNLRWAFQDESAEPNDLIEVTVPVQDRRQASALKLRIKVQPNGSLESASRRITLFSRLIDEHGITSLKSGRRCSNSSIREHVTALS